MIKTYKQFLKENIETLKDADVLESIVTDSESLLKSINAQEVHMGDVIEFNSENFNNIDELVKDQNFLRKLDSKGYKKNNVEYSKDCETFLERAMDIKFFLIFNKEDSELDPKPEYIVFQNKEKVKNDWNKIKIYKVNDNIRNFYDNLSSKTIEIIKNGKNYIFRTSNAGNDWKLQNIQNKDTEFKDIMSNDELKVKLQDGNTIVKVIGQ